VRHAAGEGADAAKLLSLEQLLAQLVRLGTRDHDVLADHANASWLPSAGQWVGVRRTHSGKRGRIGSSEAESALNFLGTISARQPQKSIGSAPRTSSSEVIASMGLEARKVADAGRWKQCGKSELSG